MDDSYTPTEWKPDADSIYRADSMLIFVGDRDRDRHFIANYGGFDSTPIFWTVLTDRVNRTPWLDAFATAAENRNWHDDYRNLAEWEKELLLDFETIFYDLHPSRELDQATMFHF